MLWRVVHASHAASAWDGEGGRLVDGRWHTAGRRVVYASEHAALAVLEKMVHLADRDLSAFRLARATLPDALVEDAARLPRGWDATPSPAAARAWGDAWLSRGEGVAVRVPSSLVPGSNVLVNPAHARFSAMDPRKVEAIPFAARARRA